MFEAWQQITKIKVFQIVDRQALKNAIKCHLKSYLLLHTANVFDVIFTVFNCVPISIVISLDGLQLIAAPSTVEYL